MLCFIPTVTCSVLSVHFALRCKSYFFTVWEYEVCNGLLDIATVTKGGGSLRRLRYSTVVPNLYVCISSAERNNQISIWFGNQTNSGPIKFHFIFVHIMQVNRNWNCLVTNILPNIKNIKVWNDIGWVNDIIFIGWTIISKPNDQWNVALLLVVRTQIQIIGLPFNTFINNIYCKN